MSYTAQIKRQTTALVILTSLVMLLAGTAQADYTPTSAFTDNGDGTVTHKLTGLTWMRCVMGRAWTGSTCAGEPSYYSFDQAKALTTTSANNSDWRLPSPWELITIVDYDNATGNLINEAVFPSMSSWNKTFWSGSPNAANSDYAWCVNFQEGIGTASHICPRNSSGPGNSVRLVRGGQSSGTLTTPSSDFTDNGDGTVTHKKTNLTWKRCTEGQTWTGSDCSGTASIYYQTEGLTASFAGQSDWRAPNAQELQSIFEYGAHSRYINAEIFPNTPTVYSFRSTTPWSTKPGFVRFISYRSDSYGINGDKTIPGYVRLVRGQQSGTSEPSGTTTLQIAELTGSATLTTPSGQIQNIGTDPISYEIGSQIATGTNSSLEFSMDDDSYIILDENTDLTIDDYPEDVASCAGETRAQTRALSGTCSSSITFKSFWEGTSKSLRWMTGQLSKYNADARQTELKVLQCGSSGGTCTTATIGMRGTDLQVNFSPSSLQDGSPKGAYLTLNSGEAVVTTATGTLTLQPTQTAFVAPDGMVSILAKRPSFIKQLTSAERVMNWAESKYATYFKGGVKKRIMQGWDIRHFVLSGSYLGVDPNNNLFALIPSISNNMIELGPVANWIEQASADGY